MVCLRLLAGLIATAALVNGCGGGGGGGSSGGGGTPPPGGGSGGGGGAPAFGLSARASVAPLTLPGDQTGLGSYSLESVYTALSFPNALFLTAVPGEDRLVVVRQSGELVAFDSNPATQTSSTVLDLSGQTVFAGEQGLLGLAFDPEFGSNRFLYVHYSLNNPRRSRIARFTWSASTDQVALASEKVLLEVAQPFTNHNGGMLAFGPDDLLYIAFGDGGSGGDPQNNAQDTSNFLGAILRVDPHPANPTDPYDVPADNPFVTDGGILDEIWAYGLRNPFRFSFDRVTGELWLGDVGQGSFEEINVVRAGDNLGWRVFEGEAEFDRSGNSLPDSAFAPPVLTYGRSDGIAVIGGYVYRGNRIPSLSGRYLYSDFGSGTVWAATWDGSAVTANDVIATASSPTSFGEDVSGDVLIVGRNAGISRLIENSGGGGTTPARLSETGLFTDLSLLAPASGLIEYTLSHPFWSDGVDKRRWVAVPDGEQVSFSGTAPWDFPVGTVTVKHFEIVLDSGTPARRLETRVLIHRASGWQGFTYRWRGDGSDADLLTTRETETLTVTDSGGQTLQQRYDYPSSSDCLRCHTDVSGGALGLNTRQLNVSFDYAAATDNQLRSLNNIDLFDQDIGDATSFETLPAREDATATPRDRARAYLDVNCASCHQPNGPTPSTLDLRWNTADGAMNAIGDSALLGDIGVTGGLLVAPGDRQASVLWQRMARTDSSRMPPLSSHVVDEVGLNAVGDWIDGL